MARDTPTPLMVDCPQCGRRAAYHDNPDRPFCGPRCRLIDTAAWAEGRYAIPARDPDPEADGGGEPGDWPSERGG